MKVTTRVYVANVEQATRLPLQLTLYDHDEAIAETQLQLQPALRWHAEISYATEETPHGAAKVNPAARVGPTALAMRTLLFMYQITVWRVLGLNSR